MSAFITVALKSKLVIQWQTVLGLIAFIILIYLFFNKNSRDERGRAIIGKASIISTIYFIVITSAICQSVGVVIVPMSEVDIFVMFNSMQFVFNSVIIVEIAAILILRKLQ